MKQQGITLIELLIAMAIFIVVITIVVLVVNVGVNTFQMGADRSDIRQEISGAMHIFTDKLKEAKEIKSASNQGISFWIDEDWDDDEESGEIYTFSWSGVVGDNLVM
ncbi:MAG: prepilin-type N-terminal cleavage/methylation domain-containing protein, partial [bacterium]